MRRLLLLSLFAASPLAQALQITWVPVQHQLDLSGTFAAAASNGAGLTVFPVNSLGTDTTFDDALFPEAVVDRNDPNNEIAAAFASASQATFLQPLGADSDGHTTTGVSIFGAGDSRASALTETKSRFFADEEFHYLIDARVGCGVASATTSCESFVTILDADSVPVFALRSTLGSAGRTQTGRLQANHLYTLWASSNAVSGRNAPGEASAGGSYSLQLQFATGPITTPVPEPATWAMWLAGLGALAAARRRR